MLSPLNPPHSLPTASRVLTASDGKELVVDMLGGGAATGAGEMSMLSSSLWTDKLEDITRDLVLPMDPTELHEADLGMTRRGMVDDLWTDKDDEGFGR